MNGIELNQMREVGIENKDQGTLLINLVKECGDLKGVIITFNLLNEQKKKPTDLTIDIISEIENIIGDIGILKNKLDKINVNALLNGEVEITTDIKNRTIEIKDENSI
jgi:hypothetical protein